ncbi:MAG: histidine kinase [Ferruginibacter sp.]|nr:histidine kinase [Ferruginibacter sp.]
MISSVSLGQDYSYVHYEPRDGLAGFMVYDMCQDKEGFMWYATENGASRYDGTRFRNFTTADGLPDNEVLELFSDSKGRIWLSTFSKFICYYYDGDIHTRESDPVLAQFNFASNIVTMAEDAAGNVAFCDLSNNVWVLSPDNRVTKIDLFEQHFSKPLRFVSVYSFVQNGKKQLVVAVNQQTFVLDNLKLKHYHSSRETEDFYDITKVPIYRDPAAKETAFVQLDFDPISPIYSATHLKYITSTNGCYSVDTATRKLQEQFLPGNRISNTIEDSEGNTWFSTLGNGVFKLSSKKFRSLSLDREINREVFSIERTGKAITIGGAYSTSFTLANDKLTKQDFSSMLTNAETKLLSNRLITIKYLSDSSTMLGFDSYLVRLRNKKSQVSTLPAIKSISEVEKGNILVGTARGAYLISTKDLFALDTIWPSRCTKVFYHQQKYYIGTLNGLYTVDKNDASVFLGAQHPSLQRRITDIVATPDGTLWIATHDRGLVSLKHDQVVKALNDSTGLNSNNCKSIFLQDNFLWVGTNKGLNKVNLDNFSAAFTKFSVSDGLISDRINAIYIQDSMVYVGTSQGVSYFNEAEISNNSRCILKVFWKQVSGKDLPINDSRDLEYNENNISFNFVGISFKSEGDILYRYRLEGLNNKWVETRLNTISYPTLPSGTYTFQLQAENKFGVKSDIYTTKFTIATPWFRSIWFWTIIGALTVASMWALISLRFRIINRNKEEKLDFRQRIADLEQLALRAQMNPHFIFNCLNSIQNFIINGDLILTNRYMNSFARLLRQTLDHSTKRVISLAEEISYITTYLELEKMRFGEKFIYKISVDESVPMDFTFIPNMILQPFIENSIRHGILHKNSGQGIIEIKFEQDLETLTCIVSDNGIGRKHSLANKTDHHIEYHSKGMQLTFKRLELLSTKKETITTTITDAQPENEQYPGTRVTINFPLTIIDKLNKQR